MSIAQELRDQEMRLRDPATKWVRGCPSYRNLAPQACAVVYKEAGGTFLIELSLSASRLLGQIVGAELPDNEGVDHWGITSFNDFYEYATQEMIISMIEEAAYWAEEEGL